MDIASKLDLATMSNIATKLNIDVDIDPNGSPLAAQEPRLVMCSPNRRFVTGRPRPTGPIALPSGSDPCPFCPGQIRPMTDHIPGPDGQWAAAAVPNRFPAGSGQHEVLVLDSAHDWGLHTGSVAESIRTCEFVARRRRAIQATGAGWVSSWLSYGATAGSSQPHPHAQVLAMPRPPAGLTVEAAHFSGPNCVICEGVHGNRLVIESDGVAVLAPTFPLFTYELLIAPARHTGRLSDPARLGPALRSTLRVLLDYAGSWPYNVVWHAASPSLQMHAHVHVLVRDIVPGAAALLEGWSAPDFEPHELAAEIRPLLAAAA